MQRFFLTAAIMAAVAVPAAAAQRVTVPAHLPIKLVDDTPVTAYQSSHSGDEIVFHVTEPVVVAGWIVIAGGAKAYGHVVTPGETTVEKGRGLFNSSAHMNFKNVVFAMDYIMSAEGTKIKLDGQEQSPDIPQSNPYFKYGQLMPNQVIMSRVDHTVHILAKDKSAGGSGGYAE